ncbi:MAG: hypothetical protein H8D38_05260 [DPANN group archaeon]|nr:hypothetical protein [DPANN group archaeon]
MGETIVSNPCPCLSLGTETSTISDCSPREGKMIGYPTCTALCGTNFG